MDVIFAASHLCSLQTPPQPTTPAAAATPGANAATSVAAATSATMGTALPVIFEMFAQGWRDHM
ncbi:MAG TPA: hypothetical protein VK797_21910 [Tepidisphaeraceae bacterium]|nr:hypothetical protein [Tepidisphaeraceae bacterium]